jgi:hypothetical protein
VGAIIRRDKCFIGSLLLSVAARTPRQSQALILKSVKASPFLGVVFLYKLRPEIGLRVLFDTLADHSGLMSANLITFAHFSVSSAMYLPNSAGDDSSCSIHLVGEREHGY